MGYLDGININLVYRECDEKCDLHKDKLHSVIYKPRSVFHYKVADIGYSIFRINITHNRFTSYPMIHVVQASVSDSSQENITPSYTYMHDVYISSNELENQSNFIDLVTRVSVDNGIVRYTPIDIASTKDEIIELHAMFQRSVYENTDLTKYNQKAISD